MSLTAEEITQNRRIALERLRLNPAAHKQIRMRLTDKNDGYCATGEIAEGLHFSPLINSDGEVYDAIKEKLDIDPAVIWRQNDRGEPFGRIADYLSKIWRMN